MSSQLPNASGCCTCGTNPVVVQIPGPTGPAGSNGTNGSNGVNAYCTTTAQFINPNTNFTVTVSVDSTTFLPTSPGGAPIYLFIGNAGYYQVISFSSHSILVKNIQAVPGGTVVALGQKVTIAGPIGLTGSAGGGAPSTSTYVINTADASLPNAQILASLATGYAKVTTTTGLFSTVTAIPATDISGTLAANHGGTGQNSYTIGDILYASGVAALTPLNAGATYKVLTSQGPGAAPIWNLVSLSNSVSGILPIANGGTGANTAGNARINLGLGNVFNPEFTVVYLSAFLTYTVPIKNFAGLGEAFFVIAKQATTTVGPYVGALFDVTTGRYTPTSSGYFMVEVDLYLNPALGNHAYGGQILLNGAVSAAGTGSVSVGGWYESFNMRTIVQITTPNVDYIQFALYSDTGVSTNFGDGSKITITKISA